MFAETLLFFLLIITIVVSFNYKIYLRNKIDDPDNKKSAFNKRITFIDFFPLQTKNAPENEIDHRRKANIALIVFYSSIILEFITVYIIQRN